MASEWSELVVMFSDCCVPGEGEHKIMDFLRFSKQSQIFPHNTTHCVYSPDADVILLTLSLNLQNIWIIKEDTSKSSSMSWTASCSYRNASSARFELVMINVLREYLAMQFANSLVRMGADKLSAIIDDFVLLMALVGNDFLPTQFCFAIKEQ